MAITVKRNNRERRTQGVITFDIASSDVGKTYDFMGVAKGFRVVDVNVTVDEAFANADNTIEVGIEGDTDKFIAPTAMNAIKGIGFNDKQWSVPKTMAIVCDIKGTASATGKATVTVVYAKQADARQEY